MAPMFIFPVFRNDGYFMLLSQFQDGKYCILTSLEEYKTNPAAAQPYLAFSFFDELANSKKIGLGATPPNSNHACAHSIRMLSTSFIAPYSCQLGFIDPLSIPYVTYATPQCGVMCVRTSPLRKQRNCSKESSNTTWIQNISGSPHLLPCLAPCYHESGRTN